MVTHVDQLVISTITTKISTAYFKCVLCDPKVTTFKTLNGHTTPTPTLMAHGIPGTQAGGLVDMDI